MLPQIWLTSFIKQYELCAWRVNVKASVKTRAKLPWLMSKAVQQSILQCIVSFYRHLCFLCIRVYRYSKRIFFGLDNCWQRVDRSFSAGETSGISSQRWSSRLVVRNHQRVRPTRRRHTLRGHQWNWCCHRHWLSLSSGFWRTIFW